MQLRLRNAAYGFRHQASPQNENNPKIDMLSFSMKKRYHTKDHVWNYEVVIHPKLPEGGTFRPPGEKKRNKWVTAVPGGTPQSGLVGREILECAPSPRRVISRA